MNKLDFKSLTIGGLLSALIFVSLGAAEQGKHEAGTFVPYVINEKGFVEKAYEKVSVKTHAKDVLAEL